MIPGEYILKSEAVELNAGRRTDQVVIRNTGDRPIQVGSHCHFFEINPALHFDREKAYGMRLNIPAGMAVRFEPGDSKEVELVEVAGRRTMFGIQGWVSGKLDDAVIRRAALAAPASAGVLQNEDQ